MVKMKVQNSEVKMKEHSNKEVRKEVEVKDGHVKVIKRIENKEGRDKAPVVKNVAKDNNQLSEQKN